MDPNDELAFDSENVKIYKSGRIVRSETVDFRPPSPDSSSGVCTKDVMIPSPVADIPARLFLPKIPDAVGRRLPVVVYYHGGAFWNGSAFASYMHDAVTSLSARARAIVVSVEYRLAPENPIPAAYDDSWAALKWVASHATGGGGTEPWLLNNADFDRLFVAGDSAGANIAYNMAMKNSADSALDILGVVLIHPYFMGTSKVDSENIDPTLTAQLAKFWEIASKAGIGDPRICPAAEELAELAKLGSRKVLVCICEREVLRDRGRDFYQQLKMSGWPGEVKLWEATGEEHVFHLRKPNCEQALAQEMVIADFINS